MRPPPPRRNLRWIIDYLQASDNEILFDSNDFLFLKKDPENYGYFPRPTKWINRVGSHSSLSKLFWVITSHVWRFGGAYLFHVAQFAYFFIYCKFYVKRPTDLVNSPSFALALSSRAAEVIRRPNIEEAPNCWVTFPWAPISKLPGDSREFDAFVLIGTSELFRALIYSFIATGKLMCRRGSQQWPMHSYTAFRWFAVREAVAKLDGDLFIAEHYDRWAILVDSIVCSRRRIESASASTRLALIQHGRIAGFNEARHQSQLHIDLRRRLKAVSKLYVYDELSEQIFRNSVLSPSSSYLKLQVSYFRPTVLLQDTPRLRDDEIQVLFVGHPACERLHTFLFKRLKEKHAVKAYYKPHPLMNISTDLSELEWTVIQDKTYFPRVDFLVSYPSTLVDEYSSCGITAAVHPIDLSSENSDKFLSTIFSIAKVHSKH